MRLLVVLSLFCFWPLTVQATEPLDGHVGFVVENDLFWGGTDRHYTNGLRLDWMPKDPWEMFGLGPFMERLVGGTAASPARRYFQLGQNMYTPNDLSRTDVVLNDRPYAGWLYVTAGAVHQTATYRDRLELTVGVVGPSSLAGDLQRRWHELINAQEPKGWANQLRDEPGVVLFYERQWLFGVETNRGWRAEALPHANVALGNVYTYAGAGLTVRFGHNVPNDGGPPRIRYGLPGSLSISNTSERRFGWYIFAGVEGRAVARNIFLDGNTFRNSHSVRSKTLVGDASVGVAVVFGAMPIRIAYSFTWRTKEFAGQDRADRFGSISITITY